MLLQCLLYFFFFLQQAQVILPFFPQIFQNHISVCNVINYQRIYTLNKQKSCETLQMKQPHGEMKVQLIALHTLCIVPVPVCAQELWLVPFAAQQASLFSGEFCAIWNQQERRVFFTFLYAGTLRMTWSGCSSVWKPQWRNGLHFQNFHLSGTLLVGPVWGQRTPSADREPPVRGDCSSSGDSKYQCPLAFLPSIRSFPGRTVAGLKRLCCRVAPTC